MRTSPNGTVDTNFSADVNPSVNVNSGVNPGATACSSNATEDSLLFVLNSCTHACRSFHVDMRCPKHREHNVMTFRLIPMSKHSSMVILVHIYVMVSLECLNTRKLCFISLAALSMHFATPSDVSCVVAGSPHGVLIERFLLILEPYFLF